jgi:D-3-phosphoglycerate dehydrogenase
VTAGEDGTDGKSVAILGTRYPDFSIEEEVLRPLGVVVTSGDGRTRDAIIEQARDAEVILAGSAPRFDAATLDALQVRGIVRYGVGTETIDVTAAAARGICVAYVPDYGTEAVAIHTVTLALAALRKIVAGDASVRSGRWGFAELRPLHLPSALTVGILGLGRIGRRVGTMLAALGFDVVGHDPYAGDVAGGIPNVSFEEVLACDVVSLHAPAPSDGRPLIDAAALDKMKASAILVNTSRGSVIDESALMQALRDDRLGMAALDVFASEPVDPSAFEGVGDRLVLSPHMAWYSQESERDLREKAANEAARILRGERPLNPVGGER